MLVLHVEPQRAHRAVRQGLEEAGAQVDYLECSDQRALLRALSAKPYETLFLRLGLALDQEALHASPSLRFAVTPTTGLDHIDLEAAYRQSVKIISLRGETRFLSSIRTTAEHTWTLMLACMRHLAPALEDVQEGRWRREPFLSEELQGKTLGILGLGRLGSIVAGYGQAFGMTVLAHDLDPAVFENAPRTISPCSRDQLLAESDVVTLHLPLDDRSHGYLDAAALNLLTPGAVLINTARGELIDETALLLALQNGRLAAVGLDVLNGDSRWSEDGPGKDHPLVHYARNHNNLLITPHMAGYGRQAILRTRLFTTEKFLAASGLTQRLSNSATTLRQHTQ